MLARVAELPLIISVDDHVVEPADVWAERLPAKYTRHRPPHRPGSDGRDHVRRRQAHGATRLRRRPHRLVVLRGAAPTAPAPRRRGRRAARRGDHHRRHLRRHAPRCVPGEAPPRGHGHQPSRGVVVLPDLPPLLRADLHRGRRQGPGAVVREGLQRLDGGRVVRGVGGPAHPVVPHPAVGRHAGGRRSAAQRGARGEGRVLQRDPPVPGAAVGARPRPTTGTRSSRPVPRPAPSSTCTSGRRRRCRRPPPTPLRRWARR